MLKSDLNAWAVRMTWVWGHEIVPEETWYIEIVEKINNESVLGSDKTLRLFFSHNRWRENIEKYKVCQSMSNIH